MNKNSGEHLIIDKLLKVVGEANADIASLQQVAKAATANPRAVIAMLGACLSERRLRDISAGAYWHANGFAKFTLVPSMAVAPLRLRLHVWLTDEEGNLPGGDQNVHGHRWNFGSAVIAGSGLRVDEYVRGTGSGQVYDAYEYRPDGVAAVGPEMAGLSRGAFVDGLERAGTAMLEHAVTYRVGLHDTYACDLDTLHTVRPVPGPLTATLVMQGPTLLAAAPVYRRADQGEQASPRAMTHNQARAVLTAVIEAASTSGSA